MDDGLVDPVQHVEVSGGTNLDVDRPRQFGTGTHSIHHEHFFNGEGYAGRWFLSNDGHRRRQV